MARLPKMKMNTENILMIIIVILIVLIVLYWLFTSMKRNNVHESFYAGKSVKAAKGAAIDTTTFDCGKDTICTKYENALTTACGASDICFNEVKNFCFNDTDKKKDNKWTGEDKQKACITGGQKFYFKGLKDACDKSK